MYAVAAAILGMAVLWVPGAIAGRVLRDPSTDRIARFGGEIAAGLAFWPVVLLLTTTAHVSWSVAGARLFFAGLIVVQGILAFRGRRRPPLRSGAVLIAALVLIAIVAITRVTQIGGIVYPLWVDSVHHTMIVRLIIEHGALPQSYAPFIPASTFYYHWGFHAVVAFVSLITGVTSPSDLPRLLLFFGQVLNVLVFPSVYCGALGLLRSRRAALLAATLATLVSFYPAYYVSWGRYTQLCGLLILPPLAVAFWNAGRHPSIRTAARLAFLAAGLLLVHVRVAVIFAVLALILTAILVTQRRWSGIGRIAVAAIVALVVVAPWLRVLATTPQVRTIMAPDAAERSTWETANGIPPDILWAPNNAPLFSLATGGLFGLTPVRRIATGVRVVSILWWLVLVVLLQRHGRRSRHGVRRHDGWRLAIPAAWIALTALLINLDSLHLPRLRMLSNSAAIIMLFLPLSVMAAHLVRWACDEVVMRRRTATMIALTLTIGGVGALTMIRIVNPQTVLVTGADRDALAWIRVHTPPDARFAVGVQPWIAGSYMGIDGGYWIPVVCDRRSILPPGLYPWVMSRNEAARTAGELDEWRALQQSSDPSAVATLRAAGITHVFFGERNITPVRGAVASSPSAQRVYESDGVEVYALLPLGGIREEQLVSPHE